jgi:hypothetical protein
LEGANDIMRHSSSTAAQETREESCLHPNEDIHRDALDIQPPLRLTYFDECARFARKRWMLKGLLAYGETSSWIGPPGAGKSAIMTEVSVHCAANQTWRGCKSIEKRGVLIIALERADLYRRRLSAYRKRDGYRNLPIAICGSTISLLNPDTIDQLIATVREAERVLGIKVIKVGLLVIDTYAKALAAGGGDENSAKDQNRAAANLARLHDELDLHVALVGHTGKNEDRGARGSNAHEADIDLMVRISGQALKTAKVTKANDQAEREIARFRLAEFEIDRDEDGDPITTAIVESGGEDIQSGATDGGERKLPDRQRAALNAPEICSTSIVPDTRDDGSVSLETWKERMIADGILNERGNPREQFKRIRDRLAERSLIKVSGDRVWLLSHCHTLSPSH